MVREVDLSFVLLWRINSGERTRRRKGDVRTILRRWEGMRRWWCFADMATRTLPSCGRSCNVVSKQSRHSRATRMDLRSQTGLILLINSFQTKFPATPRKWPPVGANEERESKCWLSEHPGCHGVALDTLRGGALRWYRSWGGSLVQFALLSTTFFEGKKKKNRPDFGKNLKLQVS